MLLFVVFWITMSLLCYTVCISFHWSRFGTILGVSREDIVTLGILSFIGWYVLIIVSPTMNYLSRHSGWIPFKLEFIVKPREPNDPLCRF